MTNLCNINHNPLDDVLQYDIKYVYFGFAYYSQLCNPRNVNILYGILTYEGYIDICDVYSITDSYRKTSVVQDVFQLLQHFKVNSTDLKFNYVFIELW